MQKKGLVETIQLVFVRQLAVRRTVFVSQLADHTKYKKLCLLVAIQVGVGGQRFTAMSVIVL